MTDKLRFLTNYNGKLYTKFFTTIRRWNPEKFQEGKEFAVYKSERNTLNEKHLFNAIVRKCIKFDLNSLPEVTAYLDCGFNKEKAIELLSNLSKNRKNDVFGLYVLQNMSFKENDYDLVGAMLGSNVRPTGNSAVTVWSLPLICQEWRVQTDNATIQNLSTSIITCFHGFAVYAKSENELISLRNCVINMILAINPMFTLDDLDRLNAIVANTIEEIRIKNSANFSLDNIQNSEMLGISK